MAIDGNTAAIGAPQDTVSGRVNQGAVYLFGRTGAAWSQQARVVAADGLASDFLGFSVSLSGDSVVAGAYGDDLGVNSNVGSAYVFVRTAGIWNQQAKLTSSDGVPNDFFGYSVSMDRDTVAVGAFGADVLGAINQGAGYVFVRSGTTWSQQAKLTAADGLANDNLGFAVSTSGDSVLLGANRDDTGLINDRGSAYVYRRVSNAWSQQAKLEAPDGLTSDLFGSAVALWNDTAVVGANLDDVGGNSNQGSAWVFSRFGTTWIGPDLKALASDGAAGDFFGDSVAIDGDTAIIGAYTDTVGAIANQGSAYIFVRVGNTWIQQAKLVASDGASGDLFGFHVSISGDYAVVGASGNDIGANADIGSAYVYLRSGTTWTQQARLTAPDGAADDHFGSGVAISGDTVLVGASDHAVFGAPGQGAAYVFVRSGTTWPLQTTLTANDGAAFDHLGASVSLDHDTALIGAFSADIGSTANAGCAYVFVRTNAFWQQQGKLFASDGESNDLFGDSVSVSGDTALVGASSDNIGTSANQGSAYVFVRSGSSWSQQAKLVADDGSGADVAGSVVSLSGDLALLNSPGHDLAGLGGQGAAYLFARSGTAWTQRAKLTAFDAADNDAFSSGVALSGSRAIVGAQQDDTGLNSNQGSFYSFDVGFDDFSLAHHDATDVNYPSLTTAFLPAQSGSQITATEAAWRNIVNLDTLGRSFGLVGSSDIRTPSTSTLTLGGSTLVQANGLAAFFGQLRVSSGASATIGGGSFLLGSRGTLTTRTSSSLFIDSPYSSLEGQTRLEQFSSMTFAGDATAIGPVTGNFNAAINGDSIFTNLDTLTITTGTVSVPLLLNRATFDVFGSSAVFGSFTNDIGSTTTIRSGSLFVFGTLTNNGTIVGTICSNCAGSPPNLNVGGSLVLGSAASLSMPFSGSSVYVGGAFDCAINSNTRFDLSLAELQMEGSAAEQTLEVMSTDIGPDPFGLDRNAAGHYPTGTLHIGPASSTVRLVDAHDNDGLGQAACEALYVDHLQIDAGSHLINPSCRIYYNTAAVLGSVDVPANLIQITSGPTCDPDTNQDGNADQGDIDYLINVVAGGNNDTGIDPDFNHDGNVDQGDVDALINVVAGGECP